MSSSICEFGPSGNRSGVDGMHWVVLGGNEFSLGNGSPSSDYFCLSYLAFLYWLDGPWSVSKNYELPSYRTCSALFRETRTIIMLTVRVMESQEVLSFADIEVNEHPRMFNWDCQLGRWVRCKWSV